MAAHYSVIFQLPAGYRPASGREQIFAVACGCSFNNVGMTSGDVTILGPGIAADGAVTLATPGSGYAELDGITFRAAS